MLAPEFSLLTPVYADDETPADSAEQGVLTDSYAAIPFTKLDEQGGLPIPEDLTGKITKSHTQYGDSVLLEGSVADLNALRIPIGEFHFDAGNVGRLSFDGLRDKDYGMKVEVLLYLDDGEDPIATIPLRKQMGKREWSNAGECSANLGEAGISGDHSLSLGFQITGKKDTANTGVALRSLQFCKTTIPVLYFNIDESEGTIEAMNSSEDHSVECYGSADLIVPDEFNSDTTFRDEYSPQDSLTGLSLEYIRGRGNSTWDADKKPYKVKFDKAQDLFGFGKNKHWVLIANRYDNSLVRNRMTYWLGQQLGMPYTPQCVPVEVVMNGQFYGSYLLCEQIRVGTGRVTIDDLDDIKDVPTVTDPLIETGGYLLSLDYEYDKDRSFKTESDTQFYIESPDKNVSYYYDYIRAFTQKVESAILSNDFKDATGKPYTDYLDIDRAVDYWWVQEFSENGDAYGSGSTYLYKARDSESGISKLCWGPLWDFDYVAWGDLDYDGHPEETLDSTTMPWFAAMKSDPVFIEKAKARWSEEGGLKDKVNDIVHEGGLLDQYLAQMESSYNYDHALYGPYESEYTTYKAEIEQLRSWIEARSAYVDKAVSSLNADQHTVRFMAGGKLVREVTVTGRIRAKDFPADPKKTGMVFTGWITKNGEPISAGDIVSKDLVLTAEFVSQSDIIQPKGIFFRSNDVYLGVDPPDSSGDILDWFTQVYTIVPEGAYDTKITWSSSDENIASFDADGEVFAIKGLGNVTITASLPNGVSKSFTMHVINNRDMKPVEEIVIKTPSLKLKQGNYAQVVVTAAPKPCEFPDLMWLSTNENIATVDDNGVVRAVRPGTAQILIINVEDETIERVPVTVTSTKAKKTVKPAKIVGKTVKRGGSTYKITSDKKGSRTCAFIKAKNAKRVTIPASIKYKGKTFSVNRIGAKAFAKSKKVRTVTIKTKLLTKARVKNSLKGSKVKKIKVKVGKKKLNKKYVKKYKKIFKKKNAGRKVRVK